MTATTLGVVTTANAYNTFGELIRQEAKTSGNPIFSADYTRDLLGRITRKVEVIEGVTDTWDYAYDPAGRLQEVYRNGGRLSRYEYDANGNRIAHITPMETITATYDDQDRLLTYGDITYTYTANGELATKTQNGQTVRYQYDELGSLVKVTMPDGPEIEYVIDGQGRRVGKKVNGVPVKGLLYQDQLELIAELNGTTLESRWIYATTSHSPDVLLKGGQGYRLITDHLGSPRLTPRMAWWPSGWTTTSLGGRSWIRVRVRRCSGLLVGYMTGRRGWCGSGPGTMTRGWGGGWRRNRSSLIQAFPTFTPTVQTTQSTRETLMAYVSARKSSSRVRSSIPSVIQLSTSTSVRLEVEQNQSVSWSDYFSLGPIGLQGA